VKREGNFMDKIQAGYTVKSHFEGRTTNVQETYDRLIKAIREFGPVGEEPKKTSIHLTHKTALAGVATRKDPIILTIKSDRKLSSPRIHKTEQVSAKRFHHEVKLLSPDDVNNELISWLRDAYALSG
jgi:hypothetical protein